MSTFCLMVGLVLLAKAVWSYYTMHRWLSRARTTTGEVTDHARGTFLGGDAQFAVVRFSADGKPVVFQDKWPVGAGSGAPGESVRVWYNPHNPPNALVNANVIRWSLPAGWCMGAFFFFMVSYGLQGY